MQNILIVIHAAKTIALHTMTNYVLLKTRVQQFAFTYHALFPTLLLNLNGLCGLHVFHAVSTKFSNPKGYNSNSIQVQIKIKSTPQKDDFARHCIIHNKYNFPVKCPIYTFIPFSVLSGAPGNVAAITIAPTSINVSWDQIANNFIIIAYEVKYSWPLGNGQLGTTYVNTSGNSNQVILNRLQECVQYNISVRAYTSQGPRPFSGAVLDSSPNGESSIVSSECIPVSIHSIMTHSVCSSPTTTRSTDQCTHCYLCQSYLELSSGKELHSPLLFC